MSGQIPAVPVVEILISNGRLKVNGRDVVTDGPYEVTQLRQLGVHEAARRVAQPLDRPVRAIARDSAGSIRMVIHPDGHVSDVEDPDAPARSHWSIPFSSMTPRSRGLAAVAGGLIVATCAVIFTPSGSSEPAPNTSTTQGPPTTNSPSGPSQTPDATPAELRVSASPGPAELVLTVSSNGPTDVLIVVEVNGMEAPVERKVTVPTQGAEVTVTGLSPGTATWTVAPPGGTSVRGTAQISQRKDPTQTRTVAPHTEQG